MVQVARVQQAMIDYFDGDIRRINHFLKVYGFAKAIGELEGLDSQTQYITEVAALTHDIGIKVSEQKYRSAAGNYQQLEGPAEARALLMALHTSPQVIERVCWLIAHHHTYDTITGQDYQILVEADFLVNMNEDAMTVPAIQTVKRQLFKTQAGTTLLDSLYLRGQSAAPGV